MGYRRLSVQEYDDNEYNDQSSNEFTSDRNTVKQPYFWSETERSRLISRRYRSMCLRAIIGQPKRSRPMVRLATPIACCAGRDRLKKLLRDSARAVESLTGTL